MTHLRSLVLGAALALAPTLLASNASAAPDGKAAPAADGPGTKVVRGANATLETALKQKVAAGSPEEKKLAAEVTKSVRDFLDIDQLGQLALGDHWAKMSAAQQKDFLDTLRALIEDNYIKGLRANLAYTVTYTGEKVDGKDTVVDTKIGAQRNGRPYEIKVSYVLRDQGGKLKAFDVKTDGVGLVANYKVSFDKIIAKDGLDGLIAKMKKKQAAGATAP